MFLVFLLGCLCIFWENGPVSDMSQLILSLSVANLALFIIKFQRAEFFYISDVQPLIVSFGDHAFVVKSYHNKALCHLDFLLCYLLGLYIVLHFTFRSMIHYGF